MYSCKRCGLLMFERSFYCEQCIEVLKVEQAVSKKKMLKVLIIATLIAILILGLYYIRIPYL